MDRRLLEARAADRRTSRRLALLRRSGGIGNKRAPGRVMRGGLLVPTIRGLPIQRNFSGIDKRDIIVEHRLISESKSCFWKDIQWVSWD